MKTLTVMAAVIMLALPVLAAAQDDAEQTKEPTLLERIQKTAELIETSQEAREAGIPDDEVAEVLQGARERGLSPTETEAVLAESTASVEESGPVDNFGAFVQAQLDEGLRGQELAEAIHAEHKAHGKGKGHGKHKGKKEHPQGHKKDHEGRHSEGDHDDDEDHDDDHDDDGDDDPDDDDDDQDEKGHGKSGQKGKGKK